jgi:peptide/nickel transport system substrate-binding protein
MEDRIRWPEASRREFLWSSSMLVGASVLATDLLDVAAAMAAGEIKDVPRNRTLVTVRGGTDGKHTEHELWSPYVIGSNPQLGGNIIYEPLAFYSAFADKEILWLAESYSFNDDYTELTVKTRSGIAWSDGKPFSADDVAYSLNTLNELGAKVKWGKDVQEVLDHATVVDPNTTLLKFKVPAPRFFIHMLSYKYDIGLHIVPKHIFEGQDWTTFAAYDLKKGWPVTTGPWKVVNASPTQKVFDRRDSWWGVEAGVGKLPEVERIVLLPDAGEQQLAQGLISNAVDFSTGLQVATFPTVFAGNPNITTFTGKELPWGNVDWWPTSLYLNCERAPFNDPKFRWAISYLIDRQVLIEVGWGGASSLSPLPMPDGSVYKGLEPYFESAAPLLRQYPTNAFDPDKGAKLLDELGWKKGGDGLYQTPDGNPFTLDIISFFDFPSVGPVLVEVLRRQGVNATYGQPPDMFDRFFSGDFNAAIFGHGGSVREPYATLRLYQSSASPLPGGQAQHLVNLARWKNKDFDLIADEMYRTPPTDTVKMQELWLKAMAIWLPELPDVQLMQFYHRLPMNLTYWKNYPTQENPYVNPAFFHSTFALVLHNLEAVS